MTDEAKSWIVDGLKGTSLLAILAAVASGAWLLAEMNSQIKGMQSILASQERERVGSRLTALELRLESFGRDQERLEDTISREVDSISKRIDRMDRVQ